MHLREMRSGTPPSATPVFNPTPQHRSSTRVAPSHSAHAPADSDEAKGSEAEARDSDDEAAAAAAASPARRRFKRTKSLFGRAERPRANGGGGGGGGGGRKRKASAMGGSGGGEAAAEDGSAVVCGAVCKDCDMVFSRQGGKYYKHVQVSGAHRAALPCHAAAVSGGWARGVPFFSHVLTRAGC